MARRAADADRVDMTRGGLCVSVLCGCDGTPQSSSGSGNEAILICFRFNLMKRGPFVLASLPTEIDSIDHKQDREACLYPPSLTL